MSTDKPVTMKEAIQENDAKCLAFFEKRLETERHSSWQWAYRRVVEILKERVNEK